MKEIAFSMMCTPFLSFNSNRPLYITDSFVVSPVGSHEYCPAMAFNRHVLPDHMEAQAQGTFWMAFTRDSRR
jgi:hypothetical protein